MASKSEQGSGEVTIYDPGAQQGRLEQATAAGNPYLGVIPWTPDVQLAPAEAGIVYVTGSPEGVVTAPPGSLALSNAGTVYVKGSGSGNTGWVALGAGGGGPFAACAVDGAGVILSKNAGVFGCVRLGPGQYEIALTAPHDTSDAIFLATPNDTIGPNGVWYAITGSGSFHTVWIWDDLHNGIDCPFSFAVFTGLAP